jgi:hypothetical protein
VKKDISLHGICDKMTMWNMFGRLANTVPRKPSPERIELQMTGDFFRAA